MNELGARDPQVREVEAFEQCELLQEDRTLAPGAGLEHGVTAVVERDGRLEGRSPRGQVLAGQKPGVAGPGRVHRLGAHEAVDRFGDEPLVPEGACAVEFLLPRAAARLVDDALVRRGRVLIPEERSGARDAVAEEHVSRRRPFVTEHPLDEGDRRADPRHDRKTVLRESDRELEDVAERPCSELAQHQQPAVECTGYDGGEQSGTRNEVEVELAKARDRRRGGCGPLSADHDDVVAFRAVDDRGEVAAGPIEMRLDDLQCKSRGDSGVECVAPALEHGHPGGGGEPVRRRHHPEGAAQLGSSREPHHERL